MQDVSGVHVKPVGPAHNLDLPTADPAPALAEMERRRELASNPGPTTILPDAVLLAKRAAYERDKGGFWICNFANERFSTVCDRPNVRALAFVPTYEEGKAKIAEFMLDPRVKSIPCLVAANKPFLIPYSEASAAHAGHTLTKVQRLATRHIDFCKFRDDDFKRSVEEKTPGETGLSDYHRRKSYLSRQQQMRNRDRERGRDGSSQATVTKSDAPSLFREASASTSFGYDTVMSRIAQSKDGDKPSFGSTLAGPDGKEQGMTAAQVFNKARGVDTETAAKTVARDVSDGGGVAATETLWKGDLPSHWKPQASGTTADGVADATGVAAPVTAGEWPRELESRHGRHVCITFIDDMDKPEDSPAFPDAAGMEPMMVLFGGEFEDVEAAKANAKNDIGPWCTDLTIDVVDMYEWLWPTEVDPDKMKEEHRTANAGYTKEANMIETQRKKTLALTAEARAHAAAKSITLRETNANEASLPEIDDAVTALRNGMFLHGEVVQLDNDGAVIVDGSAASVEPAAVTSYTTLPEA